MNIFKKKGLICFIAAIIITLSIPLTVLADDITWCPGCGRYTLDIYYNPEPTCTVNGVLEYSCGYCSYFRLEAVPPYGHQWNVPAATCEVDKECIRCGIVEETQTGHNLVWNTYYGRWQCINSGCSYYQY